MVTPVEPGTWKLSDDNRKLSFTLSFPDIIERNGVKIGKCTVEHLTSAMIDICVNHITYVTRSTHEADSTT
jgi:hypothetical protein